MMLGYGLNSEDMWCTILQIYIKLVLDHYQYYD